MQPFDFKGNPVRVVMIDDEPWFVATDVASVLGYARGSGRMAVSRLPERMKGATEVDTPGGLQKVTALSEAGVNRLVMRSQLPSAEAFQDWIAEEVLPSIRKTGSYVQPSSALDHLAVAEQLINAMRTQQAQIEQVATQQRALGQRVEQLEENHGRVTAVGYANVRGIRSDVQYLNRLGRIAARLAAAEGIPISRVHSTIWGEVNAWPVETWDAALDELDGR